MGAPRSCLSHAGVSRWFFVQLSCSGLCVWCEVGSDLMFSPRIWPVFVTLLLACGLLLLFTSPSCLCGLHRGKGRRVQQVCGTPTAPRATALRPASL